MVTNEIKDTPYLSCRQILANLENQAYSVTSLVEQLKSRIGAFKTLVSSSVTAQTTEYFSKSNPSTRSSLDSITSITIHGNTFKVSTPNSKQRLLTIKVSDVIHIEEGLALALIQELDENASFKDVLILYREERLALIRLFETILRLAMDMENQMTELGKECLGIVREVVKSDPKTLENITTKVALLSKYTVDDQLRNEVESQNIIDRLMRYVLLEQQHLLQIGYLLKISNEVTVSVISHMSILHRASSLQFGHSQIGISLVEDHPIIVTIETLWIFLLLTLFGVFDLSRPYNLPQVESPSYYMSSPEHFIKLNSFFEKLPNSKAAGPLLIGWVCVLTRMVKSIDLAKQEEYGLPDIWESVAEILQSSAFENKDSRLPFTSRAFKCNVLETFTSIARSSLFDDANEPNATAYQHHLRELVATFLTIVEPQYVPNFDTLIEFHVAIYRNRPHLSNVFWADLEQIPERGAILEVTAARFPATLAPLLKLSTALASTAPSDDFNNEPHDTSNARNVLKLLCNLSGFTVVMDDIESRDSFDVLEVDTSIVHANELIRFPNGPYRSIKIDMGTEGRIVSSGAPFVIRWQRRLSAIQHLSGILEEMAAGKINGEDTASIESVEMIFDLFANTIQKDKELAKGLILHASEINEGSPLFHRKIPNLIETIFNVLQRLLSFERRPLNAIAKGLECLAAIAPGGEYAFWQCFRHSSLVSDGTSLRFTPRGSRKSFVPGPGGQLLRVLQDDECPQGRYPVTLAFLDLTYRVIELAQGKTWGSRKFTEEQISCVNEVALGCVKYLQMEIYSSHLTWKYNRTADRTFIQLGIFRVQNFILTNSSPYAPSQDPMAILGSFITNCFIGDAATLQHVMPLTHILSTSFALQHSLRCKGEVGLAEKCELALCQAFRVAKMLLKKRIIAKQLIDRPGLLEQHFFDRIRGNELINTVAKYFASSNEELSVVSAEVLALLAVQSSKWKQKPSWLGYLNDESIINAFKENLSGRLNQVFVSSWNLVAVFVENQPGFAAYLLNGAVTSSEGTITSAMGTSKSNSKPLSSPLTIAIDFLISDKVVTAWREAPECFTAVVRFVDVLWRRLGEYRSLLDVFRKEQSRMSRLWQSLMDRIDSEGDEYSSMMEDPIERAKVCKDACNHFISRAHISMILSSEITFASNRSGNKACLEQVVKLVESEYHRDRLIEWILNVDIDLEKRQKLQQLCDENHFTLDIVKRTVWSNEFDMDRCYGSSFIYDINISERRIEEELDELWKAPFVNLIALVNEDLSLADCRVALLRSLNKLIGSIALSVQTNTSLIRNGSDRASKTSEGLIRVLSRVSKGLITNGVNPVTVPAIMAIRAERISLLVHAFQPWHIQLGSTELEDTRVFIDILDNLVNAAESQEYPLAESLRGQTSIQYHRDLLQLIYLVLRRLRVLKVQEDQSARLKSVSEQVYSMSAHCIPIICSMAIQKREDVNLACDLETLCSLVTENLQIKDSALASVWLPAFITKGVISSLLNVFRHAADDSIELVAKSTRPSLVEPVLSVLLRMSKIALVAQYLASEGLMAAFLNNSLSIVLQEGRVPAAEFIGNGEGSPALQSPIHMTWISMISLVTSVLIHLGDSCQFVRVDVTAFLQSYAPQLHRSLNWQVTANDALLTSAHLDEMRAVTLLYTNVAGRLMTLHRSEIRSRQMKLVQDNQMIRVYVDKLVILLQQLVYLLVHPTQLSGIIEPLQQERRLPGEKFIKMMTDRIAVIVASIIQSMMILSDAEHVVTHDSLEWPLDRAFIWPNLSVTLESGASIGTLFDLCSWALDTYKESPSATLVTIMEYSLTLIATQMSLHLFVDDGTVLEPRQRRDMTGEIANDLGNTCEKVDQVMARSGGPKLDKQFLPFLQSFISKWIII